MVIEEKPTCNCCGCAPMPEEQILRGLCDECSERDIKSKDIRNTNGTCTGCGYSDLTLCGCCNYCLNDCCNCPICRSCGVRFENPDSICGNCDSCEDCCNCRICSGCAARIDPYFLCRECGNCKYCCNCEICDRCRNLNLIENICEYCCHCVECCECKNKENYKSKGVKK